MPGIPWRGRFKTVRTQSAMNVAFSRRYDVVAIALSWFVAFACALPPAVSPSTAAIDGATQACSINWRDRSRFAYPAAYLLVGLTAPLTAQGVVYYGVYVGVIRASRRLHQRAIVSGRASIVNLAMRVSQSSSRWSVVSCQSHSSTSTTSSGPLSSVNNLPHILLTAFLFSTPDSHCTPLYHLDTLKVPHYLFSHLPTLSILLAVRLHSAALRDQC